MEIIYETIKSIVHKETTCHIKNNIITFDNKPALFDDSFEISSYIETTDLNNTIKLLQEKFKKDSIVDVLNLPGKIRTFKHKEFFNKISFVITMESI